MTATRFFHDEHCFWHSGGLLAPGAPVGQDTWQVARVSAGLVCNAVNQVLRGDCDNAYVPFCGLATIEALSGVRTPVVDPLLDMLVAQQPDADSLAFQRGVIDRGLRLWREAVDGS